MSGLGEIFLIVTAAALIVSGILGGILLQDYRRYRRATDAANEYRASGHLRVIS